MENDLFETAKINGTLLFTHNDINLKLSLDWQNELFLSTGSNAWAIYNKEGLKRRLEALTNLYST